MTLMFPTIDLGAAALACLVCLVAGMAIGSAFPLRNRPDGQ